MGSFVTSDRTHGLRKDSENDTSLLLEKAECSAENRTHSQSAPNKIIRLSITAYRDPAGEKANCSSTVALTLLHVRSVRLAISSHFQLLTGTAQSETTVQFWMTRLVFLVQYHFVEKIIRRM